VKCTQSRSGQVSHPDSRWITHQVAVGRGDDHELLDPDLTRRPRPNRLASAPTATSAWPASIRGEQVVGVPELDQVRLEFGVLPPPDPQCTRQNSHADREQRADVQFAGLDTRGPPRGAFRSARRARGWRVRAAAPYGPPASAEPLRGRRFEQRTAQLSLEGLDLMRQPRLADVQDLRGPRERAFVDHSHEVLQLPQRDCHAFRLSESDLLSVGLVDPARARSIAVHRFRRTSTTDRAWSRDAKNSGCSACTGITAAPRSFVGNCKPLINGLTVPADFVFVDAPSLALGDFGWWHLNFRGWERTRDWAVELFQREPHFDRGLRLQSGCGPHGSPGRDARSELRVLRLRNDGQWVPQRLAAACRVVRCERVLQHCRRCT